MIGASFDTRRAVGARNFTNRATTMAWWALCTILYPISIWARIKAGFVEYVEGSLANCAIQRRSTSCTVHNVLNKLEKNRVEYIKKLIYKNK